MEIIVISDSHGRNKEVIDYLAKYEDPDMIFYLGDYIEDGEEIRNSLSIETIMVRGNGDFFSAYKDDELVEIEGINIFLTHGHIYNVNLGLDNLIYRAQELDADIALFGHTHIPINIRENGIYIMNPGSPSFPRGGAFEKTLGKINIGDHINMEIINIEKKIV